MSEVLPEDARCAQHVEARPSWACGRCGAFLCPACERRTRPEARPMCPACWELRGRVVPPSRTLGGGTAMQTTGLVLGLVSLIPMCLIVQGASLVFNVVAILQAKEPPALQVRWRPITGLVLSCLGLVFSALTFWRG